MPRYNWFAHIFLLPKIENLVVKILAFLLTMQISYLSYYIYSLQSQNTMHYISYDSNKFYRYKISQFNSIENSIKHELLSKYITSIEENKNSELISNLSSKDLNIHLNKTENESKVYSIENLNIDFLNQSEIKATFIKSAFSHNLLTSRKNSSIKLKFTFDKSLMKLSVLEYEYIDN